MDKPAARKRPTAMAPQTTAMNPRVTELFELLFSEFLTAYEATREERPSIARAEQISIAASRIFGRSAFSMKSVLDGYPGLNLERARTLVALAEIGGKGSLGEVKEHMGLTRQAAYSRLQALCAGGYCEKRATAYGMYFMTAKGGEAAAQIAGLD
ncbi:hypothetical protein [Aureimonas sp. SK2]|uniref:hypothetical protein n=1 Tax=Aureimonas sp. SK2 TaxID=3015992 RepID=UPI002444CD42|nr:hypothetical protein [Aureimonas sp. SK2]